MQTYTKTIGRFPATLYLFNTNILPKSPWTYIPYRLLKLNYTKTKGHLKNLSHSHPNFSRTLDGRLDLPNLNHVAWIAAKEA
jgi:hypothetical protein